MISSCDDNKLIQSFIASEASNQHLFTNCESSNLEFLLAKRLEMKHDWSVMRAKIDRHIPYRDNNNRYIDRQIDFVLFLYLSYLLFLCLCIVITRYMYIICRNSTIFMLDS